MNALKMEESEPVPAADVVELLDCGRASDRTKGGFSTQSFEFGMPPFLGGFEY